MRRLLLIPTIFAAGLPLHSQTLVELAPAGALNSTANGINQFGEVTIEANIGSDFEGFIYANGNYTNIGNLGGYIVSPGSINDSGSVTGAALSPSSSEDFTAFLYSDGSLQDLGTFGGTYSEGNGINDSGTIVGTNSSVGFLYSNGVFTTTGSFFGSAINNLGVAAGSAGVGGVYTATLRNIDGSLTALGVKGQYSIATSINLSGQVVGFYQQTNGTFSTFLYSGGKISYIGPSDVYTEASSINNLGQVVGTSGGGAFIYSSAIGLQNLNTLYASLLVSGSGSTPGFVSLNAAQGINDLGEIVGSGFYWDGTSMSPEAFLLEVPEPSSGALILVALASLATYAGRYRLQRILKTTFRT